MVGWQSTQGKPLPAGSVPRRLDRSSFCTASPRPCTTVRSPEAGQKRHRDTGKRKQGHHETHKSSTRPSRLRSSMAFHSGKRKKQKSGHAVKNTWNLDITIYLRKMGLRQSLQRFHQVFRGRTQDSSCYTPLTCRAGLLTTDRSKGAFGCHLSAFGYFHRAAGSLRNRKLLYSYSRRKVGVPCQHGRSSMT